MWSSLHSVAVWEPLGRHRARPRTMLARLGSLGHGQINPQPGVRRVGITTRYMNKFSLICLGACAIALCGGCDDRADDTRVRPGDAVLSEAQLQAIATRRGGSGELTSLTTAEGCEGARTGLQQLADATGGSMTYGGGAE